MKKSFLILSVLWLCALCVLPLQVLAEDSQSTSTSTFSQAELDQILAPIALYPDSLLSQIFMASTYPASVAEAVTWSKDNPDQEGDKAVTAVQDKPWDPSVMSLVAFPQVLEMMGKQSDWVQNLGDAFLAKPDAVMDTVQKLRKKAKDEGNLKTTEQQTIIIKESAPDIIVIEPADPKVVYVPVYNPTVVYGSWWWPAYTPYYYRPPGYAYGYGYGVGSAVIAGIGFGVGVAITNSLWGGCNWRRGDVDINVNRYNSINSNNRINSNRRSTNWKHNSNNRRGVSSRNNTNRIGNNNKLGGANNRQAFRGRESSGRDTNRAGNKTGNRNLANNKTRNAERQRAQSTLKNRGNDPAAARKKLSGSGGDKVRSQVNKIDRGQSRNRSASMANNKSRDRSNFKSGASRNNTKSRNNASRNNIKSRDRAKSSNFGSNRSRGSSHYKSRNSSLSGMRNSGRSSQNFNRGSRSRSGGGHSRGGGGRSRGGGGRGGRR